MSLKLLEHEMDLKFLEKLKNYDHGVVCLYFNRNSFRPPVYRAVFENAQGGSTSYLFTHFRSSYMPNNNMDDELMWEGHASKIDSVEALTPQK